ncbi:biopolymer transporter ExbD [Helicobacter saguini]|uniref:Biopolymer transporter ExbD n=1 Tax=Helicobacter saguini TaxID=1548018 RepID=A0A347VRW3_9HELI|nr:biopolymer transporter ExbD [Helicobacter saguini]MWV62753.1 biopolymer transporter ExbD [Helicobacter saguini]MWV66578.1 biopolymer transporter ExbD [Helicobacter saguini]MWV68927.1 biopolymer transporter ExbD [Helicobacter saguini]MWV71518.1 biopolymer transporter ExbD [Helicobacter saguini]TLD93616.1 biopolymer transporter ExbD [Helicobacter saguini]
MKKIDSLNLVPFIDIMLVLLVIVLVSASFSVSSQLPIQIPKVDEETQSSLDSKQINIALDKDGDIYINSQQVDKIAMYGYLRSLESDISVIIKADKDANVQGFIDIMSALQYFGLTNVYTEVQQDY